jgi:hypothetical protein
MLAPSRTNNENKQRTKMRIAARSIGSDKKTARRARAVLASSIGSGEIDGAAPAATTDDFALFQKEFTNTPVALFAPPQVFAKKAIANARAQTPQFRYKGFGIRIKGRASHINLLFDNSSLNATALYLLVPWG